MTQPKFILHQSKSDPESKHSTRKHYIQCVPGIMAFAYKDVKSLFFFLFFGFVLTTVKLIIHQKFKARARHCNLPVPVYHYFDVGSYG